MRDWSWSPLLCSGVSWSQAGGGREGALTQSQQGSSSQPAPACSVMLYCVAHQRSQRHIHYHKQTVEKQLGNFFLVLVLLIIEFMMSVTITFELDKSLLYIFHLWNNFCSLLPGAAVFSTACGGSGKIGKLVWTDKLSANQRRELVSRPFPIGCWQSSLFSSQECGVIVVNFSARASYKELIKSN